MNERVCPHCHFTNRPGANFCAACGRHLVVEGDETAEDSPTMPRAARPVEAGTAEETRTLPSKRRFELRVGRRTDAGLVRPTNEDSLLSLDFAFTHQSATWPAGLFVVADGIGGQDAGEIASGMLVRALAHRAANEWLPNVIADREEPFNSAAWLAGAIQHGNEEIFDLAQERGLLMGTTVVAVLIEGERVFVAHVGDSRAYRLNAAGIEQLTVDHSLVESMVEAKQLSREEARHHPHANVIYRTVGDNALVTVDMAQIYPAPGDWLLLCSDGLSGMLADDAMWHLVMDAAVPQTACDALIAAAIQAGGDDNCTAILIELRPS